MKKVIKSKLFFFILGLIVMGSIEVVASEIFANNITYDNSTSHLKDSNNQDVTTVQGAIDALYTKATEPMTVKVLSAAWSTYAQSQFALDAPNVYSRYKYFRIDSVTPNNEYTDLCEAKLWSVTQSKSIEPEIGHGYEVVSSTDGYRFSAVIAISGTNTSGKNSRCWVTITLYN